MPNSLTGECLHSCGLLIQRVSDTGSNPVSALKSGNEKGLT